MDHRLCPYWLSWMYSGRCKRKYVVFRSNSSNIHTLVVCLLVGCVVTGVSWMLREPPVVSSRPPSASWLLGNPHPRCTPQKTTGFQSSTGFCTGCTGHLHRPWSILNVVSFRQDSVLADQHSVQRSNHICFSPTKIAVD